jgi:hypothetical protein
MDGLKPHSNAAFTSKFIWTYIACNHGRRNSRGWPYLLVTTPKCTGQLWQSHFITVLKLSVLKAINVIFRKAYILQSHVFMVYEYVPKIEMQLPPPPRNVLSSSWCLYTKISHSYANFTPHRVRMKHWRNENTHPATSSGRYTNV